MPDRREARPPSSPDRRKFLVAGAYVAANAAVISRVRDRSATRDDTAPAATDGATPRRSTSTSSSISSTSSTSSTAPPPAVEGAAPQPSADHQFETVITGGRVIDPDSGWDGVADVGIDGGTVTAISPEPLPGVQRIDATNLVVAPGFIDVLSYEPEDRGALLKIADGVTTNLGMHGINSRPRDFFNRFTGACPVHFGGAFDEPWARSTLFGLSIDQEPSPDVIRALADECARQLDEGWIGVDFEPEYHPGTTFAEMVEVARVAQRYGVPCFFHGRYSAYGQGRPTLEEIVNVAKESGAAVHVEHIISTGGTGEMRASLDYLAAARTQGVDVTACMYPYDFWATYLGSARFAPGWQERFRIDYGDLQVAGTDVRLTEETFPAYQRDNTLVAAYAIPEGDVQICLGDPHVMIGSDAILTTGNNHPRATGCFARTLGRYVREMGTLTLPEALAKMTILPARRLDRNVPALRRKGRLQRGADADITIFDPATVADRSTVTDPSLPSVGIEWVLINGTVVKTPQGVDESLRVGQPITGEFT